MSRTAALALVLLAASASTAVAGPYVGLGIGGSPSTSGDMAYNEDGRVGKLFVGYQFNALKVGRLSAEGIGSKFDVFRADGYEYGATNVGVAAKYNLPIADGFEVFARAGLQHTSLNGQDGIREDYSGTGFLLGLGAEYRIQRFGIFVDYNINSAKLTSPEIYGDREFGFTSRVWMLGASVSF